MSQVPSHAHYAFQVSDMVVKPPSQCRMRYTRANQSDSNTPASSKPLPPNAPTETFREYGHGVYNKNQNPKQKRPTGKCFLWTLVVLLMSGMLIFDIITAMCYPAFEAMHNHIGQYTQEAEAFESKHSSSRVEFMETSRQRIEQLESRVEQLEEKVLASGGQTAG